MTKRTKRFIAGLLTAAMVIGTFTFVSGETLEDAEHLSQTVSGNSETSTPKILIEVPTDASFVINPYKISVVKDGVSDNSAIISAKQEIINKSEVPVQVSIEGLMIDTGAYDTTKKEYAKGVTVMSGSAEKAKNKSIYLYMSIGQKKTTAADEDGIYTYEIGTGKKDHKDIKATAAKTTKNQPAQGGTLKNAIKLGAGKWNGDAYDKGGEAVEYQLMGNVNANPTKTVTKDGKKTTVADPWKSGDDSKLQVSYKFTFEPQSN